MEFVEYKETDEYKNYYKTIKTENPNMPGYLIELSIFGYFYENKLKSMNKTERKKYKSLMKNKEAWNKKEHQEIPKEYKGMTVYSSEEEWKKANPDVKDVKVANLPEGVKPGLQLLAVEEGESKTHLIENEQKLSQ